MHPDAVAAQDTTTITCMARMRTSRRVRMRLTPAYGIAKMGVTISTGAAEPGREWGWRHTAGASVCVMANIVIVWKSLAMRRCLALGLKGCVDCGG